MKSGIQVVDSSPVAVERRKMLEVLFREKGATALIEECSQQHASLAELANRVEELERLSAIMTKLLDLPIVYRDFSDSPLLKEIHVTADMFLHSSWGFYDIEFAADRTPFRWTGPRPEFQLTVHLDRSTPSKAKLTLLNGSHLTQALDLVCYVDRKRVPIELGHEADNDSFELVFDIPPLAVERTTEIACVVPAMFVPKDNDRASDDDRRLGVKFVALDIVQSENEEGLAALDSASHD